MVQEVYAEILSKIKPILRRHARRKETDLLIATQVACDAITLTDCKSFFFNAQYATSFMEML